MHYHRLFWFGKKKRKKKKKKALYSYMIGSREMKEKARERWDVQPGS